ncbi:MAG: AAA-like domain-containing protein [Leptolyngbyaceae cyanobacterium bins.302]|nr:AAA-like domain-containing protein [Leptolyngbyaceae cyanobacterium bins.302]
MSGQPPTRKILILAANPKNTAKLRLDEEVREIHNGLERSKHRDRFVMEARWAVRPDDLRRSLLDIEPQIIHFSGHGVGADGLMLEDETGQAKLISADALARFFSLFKGIECVLLNACYSEVQADAIYLYVDYVVGMSQAVGDLAAIKFAKGFYDALAAGRSYEDAYQFGCNAIDFEDVLHQQHLIPVLKHRGAASPPPPSSSTSDSSPPSPSLSQIPLEQPEGQVALTSRFYVKRPPIEEDCYAAITKPGALIRIKAARQMGKTSLMTRILDQGAKQGYRAVPIYFQEADGEIFSSLDGFLRWFCATVTAELNLADTLSQFWAASTLTSKQKCGNYIRQFLLSELRTPLVFGLDEVDLVFQHLKIAQDFFALLRTWHERGKNEALWQQLRLVIVHSKEVYIPLDMHQSPFNVGLPIELPELTQVQVEDLAERHGVSLTGDEVGNLMAMVGGHPFLVRVALYEIASGRRSLPELLQIAPTDEGCFYDHLRRHLVNLEGNAALMEAMKQVVSANAPVQIGANEKFQLRSMGLVKFQQNAVVPLCELYRVYFRDRLKR